MVLEDKTIVQSQKLSVGVGVVALALGRRAFIAHPSGHLYVPISHSLENNLKEGDRILTVFENTLCKMVYGPVVEEDLFFFPKEVRRTTISPGRIIAYSPELEIRLETVAECSKRSPTIYLTADISEVIGEGVPGFFRLVGPGSEKYAERFRGKDGSQLIRVLKDREPFLVCGPIKEGNIYIPGNKH